MKHHLSTLFSLLFSTCVLAQNNTGKVIAMDQSSNEALSFAHVKFTCLSCEKSKESTVVIMANVNGEATNPYLGITEIKVNYFTHEQLTDTLHAGESKTVYLKPSEVELDNVIITAQYAPIIAEKAVHKVKIIDSKKIEAMGAVNLKDVLTNTANVRIAQDNVLGSSTSIQGLSGQNVKILIDGVPVIGRLGGNVDLSQINLSGVDHIEIIEGPLSVEYGSNALAGTINLITKKNLKKGIALGVNSYYETVGQYNINSELGYKWKTNTIKVSGGRNYFDGWSPKDEIVQFPKSLPADTNRVLPWKPKEQLLGKFSVIKKVKALYFRLSTDYFKEVLKNKGLPKSPYYETAFDDTYDTRRWNNVLSINGKASKKSNINLLFGYNYYKRFKNTYYVDLTTLDKNLTDNPSDQDTSFFDLILARGTYSTAKDSAKFNYSIGYDVNIETAKGARIKTHNKQIGDYAVFGSIEYNPFKGFVARPGLRYSYNTSYKAPLTPSVNLKYNVKAFTFRTSYSKGFRAPSIKDLYFDFVDINHDIVGNPNLTAETSNNYSFSVNAVKRIKLRQYKANFSLFYNDIHDLITLALKEGSTGSYSYFNLDRYKTKGVQLGGDLSISHFTFSLTGTYTGRYNSLSDSLDVTAFNYSPEVRASASYEFKKYDLKLSVFYKYSGKVVGYYLDDENAVQESLLGDFHTFDATISKGFWKKRIQWVVGGKNLFDVQNIQSRGSTGSHSTNTGLVPMSWGRSVFTSLKINLDSNLFKKKKDAK